MTIHALEVVLHGLRPAASAQLHRASSAVPVVQVNLKLPEVALGPHVLTCLARVVSRTGLCQGTHLLSQTLRLMLLRHYQRNPTAAVGAAVRDGDWAAVKQRLTALPRAVVERLAAEAAELPGGDAGAEEGDRQRSQKCVPAASLARSLSMQVRFLTHSVNCPGRRRTVHGGSPW